MIEIITAVSSISDHIKCFHFISLDFLFSFLLFKVFGLGQPAQSAGRLLPRQEESKSAAEVREPNLDIFPFNSKTNSYLILVLSTCPSEEKR